MNKTVILLLFFLTSCTSAQASNIENTPLVTPTLTQPPSTPTFSAPSPTPTDMVILQVCDPAILDFCIVDGNFIFQSPVNGSLVDLISKNYSYGSTDNGRRDPHHGADFTAANGDPVLAVADGIIVFAGFEKNRIHSPWENFYGNFIVIRHANDIYTLYAHLSQIVVETGQEVNAGEVIGEVGRSGVAIGPHLHFEVRRGGNGEDYFSTENPELWLALQKDENDNLYGALSIAIDAGLVAKVERKIVIEYYPAGAESPQKRIHTYTYPLGFENNSEDAVLSNLQPGRYRIAFSDGGIRERWVDVESGRLTQVIFILK